MEGIIFIENFLENSLELFSFLESNVSWDERMKSRKTASFGRAYNYSQISYKEQEFLPELKEITLLIEKQLSYKPNNCLINFYPNGLSTMGYHSDNINIIEEGTGISIISLGETRILRFRNIIDNNIVHNYSLPSGSFIHMSGCVQHDWQHTVPKSNTQMGRMSLTFRKLI